MKRTYIAWSVAAGAALLLATGCAAWRIQESRKLAKEAVPFSISPAGANATLLLLGDSTGVGTGTSAPEYSVAGRLAKRFPKLAIENRAQNGARFADVLTQLGDGAQRYDVILIMAGGNDVIDLTGDEKLNAAIAEVAQRAASRATTVIFLPAGNVGNAPFFFAPVSWWMTRRSQMLHADIRAAAAATGARYVNLYKDKATDPFAQEPERLHAKDGLHPSDDGYANWESELLGQSDLAGVLPK